IFFVSIGMLLNPEFVIRAWPLVLLTVAMIVLVKGTVVVGIARWLGTTPRLAVLVGAALAQSGEFSFLMARVGLQQGVLSTAVFNLLLSAAVMSILLSPLVNEMVPRLFRRVFGVRAAPSEAGANPERLEGHAIVCGYGRVGSIVCDVLRRMEKPFVVIEEDFRTVEALRAQGVPVLLGDAGQAHVLAQAHLDAAELLVLAIPERMAVRRAVEYAHESQRNLPVLARTHSRRDRDLLRAMGVTEVVLGETELALALARRALDRLGVPAAEAESAVNATRADVTRRTAAGS
ncbi:MAG TPA: NAD-binding protein, partial [Gemmatimonadaceae bacterium]